MIACTPNKYYRYTYGAPFLFFGGLGLYVLNNGIEGGDSAVGLLIRVSFFAVLTAISGHFLFKTFTSLVVNSGLITGTKLGKEYQYTKDQVTRWKVRRDLLAWKRGDLDTFYQITIYFVDGRKVKIHEITHSQFSVLRDYLHQEHTKTGKHRS